MKCHAYNKNGQRCQAEPGHPDMHFISIEWDDDECWIPEHETAKISTPAAVFPAPPNTSTPVKCIVCDHAMHHTECVRCECRTGVPE